MKNLKKLLAIMLTFCIMTSGATAIATFGDVNDAYVDTLTEMGVIKGYPDTNFGPEDACTRGQFLTFLWRATGEPEAKKSEKIKDISGDEYYASAVWWAYENGITKIYSDDTFRADMPVDREHAAYYLYNWAKLYDKSDVSKTISMQKYLEDGVKISVDSRTAFSWAFANGFLSEVEDGLLKPKDTVTRLWTVNAIGKLLDNHVCKWNDWKDNGDGTHSRVCEKNSVHKETKQHLWNDGELTLAPTDTEKGLVTYTCHDCMLTKTEEAAPGTDFTTRAEIEEALVSTAFAYFSKGTRIQYEATDFSVMSGYVGGIRRETPHSSPEFATKDNSIFTVCSDFTHQCYYEGLGIKDFGDTTWPFGFTTNYLHRYAENQTQEQILSTDLTEPLTEKDVDTCIFRWMDFDEYAEIKAPYISMLATGGVFESSAFTDYTNGLTFKEDGYEGELHYSYYDENGNRLDYKEARRRYLDPFTAQEEKFFRPGDIYVNYGHALLYIGNDKFIDSGMKRGGKIDTVTGIDRVEPEGSICAERKFSEWVKDDTGMMFTVLRPLEFVVKMGYDEDPGNDIVNLTIPEKTLSRVKYPMMDIDRTVDITHYGTAVKGENLTYTVEISNKTNDEKYQIWKGEGASQDYENLVVKETLPEGTILVDGSVTAGGKVEDRTIIWNIGKIAPGETVVLSYSVKVTAEAGSVIVNDGGMVDNIPSNTIKNAVGEKKLDEAEKTALLKIAQSGVQSLNTLGDDTAFATAIYEVIGKELTIPSAGEITKALFPVKPQLNRYGTIASTPKSEIPINLYSNGGTIAEENKTLEQMLIKYFWGGRMFYVGEELRWEFSTNCIKEFKKDYLEAGDIIIYVATDDKTNLSYDFSTVGVMVYDGKNLLSSVKTANGTTYEIIDESNLTAYLTKLFTRDKDLFFALRPSQVR